MAERKRATSKIESYFNKRSRPVTDTGEEEEEVNAALKEMKLPQPDALCDFLIALGTLIMTPVLTNNTTFWRFNFIKLLPF